MTRAVQSPVIDQVIDPLDLSSRKGILLRTAGDAPPQSFPPVEDRAPLDLSLQHSYTATTINAFNLLTSHTLHHTLLLPPKFVEQTHQTSPPTSADQANIVSPYDNTRYIPSSLTIYTNTSLGHTAFDWTPRTILYISYYLRCSTSSLPIPMVRWLHTTNDLVAVDPAVQYEFNHSFQCYLWTS